MRASAERVREPLELHGHHGHLAAQGEVYKAPVASARDRQIERDHVPPEVDIRRGEVVERLVHPLELRRSMRDVTSEVCVVELGVVVAVANLLRLQLREQRRSSTRLLPDGLRRWCARRSPHEGLHRGEQRRHTGAVELLGISAHRVAARGESMEESPIISAT